MNRYATAIVMKQVKDGELHIRIALELEDANSPEEALGRMIKSKTDHEDLGAYSVKVIPPETDEELKKLEKDIRGKYDDLVNALRTYVVEGLQEDGEHHKQWYLEEIGKLVDMDLTLLEYEKGIVP